MDSDSQPGCLGNFFNRKLRRIKSPHPKSSSQSFNSRATTIASPGEFKSKGRSEVVTSEGQDPEACLDVGQQKEGIQYFSPHCDYSCSPSSEWWTSIEPLPPSYSAREPFLASGNDVSAIIERTLDGLNPHLRDLSLKIHGILAVI